MIQAAGASAAEILLGNCHNIMILLDATGSIIMSTEGFLTAINERDFKSIKGHICCEVLSKYLSTDDTVFFIAGINQVLSSGETASLYAWIDFSKNGQPKFYSIEISRGGNFTDNPDARPGVLVVITDISGFVHEKKRIESVSKAKSDFLTIMSHEIRTPVNSIVGFSELALGEDISPKTKDYLEKILENSHWLLLILNDILDISKIESGKIKVDRIPFHLNELFAFCQTIILPQALEKDIELLMKTEPIGDSVLLGDPTKLCQVLINLMSNSVKFTDSGIVRVSSSVISSDDMSVTVRFTVLDSGIGMTKEQTAKLFEPFMQGSAGNSRKYGGTGLGLTISKNLIELMGGKFSVESSPETGSKFSFNLKFEKAIGHTFVPKSKAVKEFAGKPVFEATVLVCEDNNMNQRILCEHLSRVGIKTVLASTGKEALEAVERRINDRKKPFDLIFMDINMPVMDGFEAAAKIAKLKTKTPIIAMPAGTITYDRMIYKATGMNDCISKPFQSYELWRCLLRHLTPLNEEDNNDNLPDQISEDLMRQIRTDFYNDNQTVFKKIVDAINCGNIKEAYRLTHSIKSNAANLSEDLLQKAAAETEKLLGSGEPLPADLKLGALETELKTVFNKLKPLADKAASGESPRPPSYDKRTAIELIKKIEPLIANGNPECLNYVEDLRSIPGSFKLIKQIGDFDFHPAVKELAELKRTLEEETDG